MPLAGEDGVVRLRIGDSDIAPWKAYVINSHYLTPTDAFHMVIGDEYISDEMLGTVLINGRKCTLFIDDAPQSTGYIAVVDTSGDRESGNNIVVNGYDVFSPLVRSELDQNRRYPEKLTLDHLLRLILTPFGFSKFEIDNGANRAIAANRALPQKKGGKPSRRTRKPAAKALKQYPLQKQRPHHGETPFQFLGRIMQREGLWLRPNVTGDGVIASTPDYDQAPCAELRRQRGGQRNNIKRGGIVRDSTDQPSHIVATGRVPGREVQHQRIMTAISNPLTGIENIVGGARDRGGLQPGDVEEIVGGAPNRLGRAQLQAQQNKRNRELTMGSEAGSFLSQMIAREPELYKWTTVIPAQPVDIVNPYASLVATPKYVRDDDSHTMEQLERFAKRQMSLHLRSACVGTYIIEGHRFENGVIPQVDTIVNVIDDVSRWNGPMWVLSRSFRKSRQEGTTTELELLPLGCLSF